MSFAELREQTPNGFAADSQNRTPSAVFVGGMGMRLQEFWLPLADNNCDGWFRGAAVSYVHAARTAIYKICSLLKIGGGEQVLAPAYNCGAEVDALGRGGADVRFYKISRAAEIDFKDLASRITRATKAVYVTHYFGFPQPLEPIVDLCRREGLCLIEDCALSTLTQVGGQRIGQLGAVAVYNFPKVLPVPDGGALVINDPDLKTGAWPLRAPPFATVLANAVQLYRHGFLRSLRGSDARLLLGVLRNSSEEEPQTGAGRRPMPRSYYFNRSFVERRISKISLSRMRSSNFSEIREKRRRNFLHLLDCLSETAGLSPLYRELPEGVCPLSFPILVNEPRPLMYRLAASSIPAVPWWSGYNLSCAEWDAFPDACYLKDHVLALPIHDQLNPAAIEYVGQQVRECFR